MRTGYKIFWLWICPKTVFFVLGIVLGNHGLYGGFFSSLKKVRTMIRMTIRMVRIKVIRIRRISRIVFGSSFSCKLCLTSVLYHLPSVNIFFRVLCVGSVLCVVLVGLNGLCILTFGRILFFWWGLSLRCVFLCLGCNRLLFL